MAYIEKLKLKNGTAYRVEFRQNGERKRQYFPPGTDYKVVKAFIAQIDADKLKSKINGNVAGIELVSNNL